MKGILTHSLIVFGFLFLLCGGGAEAGCGDPGEDPCSCGWLGLGKCCDYDYLTLVGECSDSAGFPTFCGGTNEPACKVWQHLTACKSSRANVDGTCRRVDSDGYPTGCGGKDESPCNLVYQVALGIGACKSGLTQVPAIGGTCRQLDSDGFPSFCGGESERPCTIAEHIPSCKSNLHEIPFPGGDCTRLDSDGYPPFCGGIGERPCNVNEHIPSCKNLLEVDGECDSLDDSGYPSRCGDVGEPGCNLGIQAALGVDECKPSTNEFDVAVIPFAVGNCSQLDKDGFPAWCGGDNERPCTIVEHIPSCKRDFEEDFLAGKCLDTYPDDCGRNGQRHCEAYEKLIPCKSGLSVRDFDFDECGEDPDSWDSAEVPRGGPRSVFMIHGRGGDFEGMERITASGFSRLANRFFFETPNIKHVYGVDWNAGGDAARKLTIRQYTADPSGTCSGTNADGESICESGSTPGERCSTDIECQGATISHEFGQHEFDVEDFRVYEIAQALSEAIVELPTEENITVITHSYGGVIGRHLVYRHYDELRRKDKRIAEVVTLMAPHLGGGMATPDVAGGELTQNTMACALDLADLDSAGFDREEWHNVCELGEWHDFRKRREDGILGPPFGSHYIDNRDYPSIRWINVVDNGFELAVTHGPAAAIDPGAFIWPLSEYVGAFKAALGLLHNLDSDGIILTSSAWGIEADECYPFTRLPGPDNKSIEVAPVLRENYLTDDDGVKVAGSEWTVLSTQCHHPDARVDSRYAEREDLRRPHDINLDVRDFVTAVLSLEGDTNGDGVVNASDQTVVAQAGDDMAIECDGTLTDVTLDGSASDDPAGGGLSFDWSGTFGMISGMTPTISLPLGSDSVSLRVEDSIGRTDSDSVLVTVQDTTPPSLNAGDDAELEATSIAGAPYTATASAIDACGPASVALSPDLSVFPLGTTELTFTATDDAGNEATAVRAVTVVDTTAPEIVAPGSLVREATGVLTMVLLGEATATDIFPVDVSNDAPEGGFPLGTTPVKWTALDDNGNENEATQDVTIRDTTPPMISAPADVTAEATAVLSPVSIGIATATDIFEVTVTHTAPPAGFPYGLTEVDWVATDTHENEASATQRVQVIDTTAPLLTVPANLQAEATAVLSPLSIGTATATDIFDLLVSNTAPVDGYPLGGTDVEWTATDIHDNASSGVQRITVVDTTAPLLDVPAEISVAASGPSTQVDLGMATATDIFEPVQVSNNAPTGFAPGITEVTWTAVDANGNESTGIQSVHATYGFSGFAPPLQSGGIYKANRTLPIKFALQYAGGESVFSAVATLSVVPLGSDDTPGEPLDIEAGATADSGGTFRSTADGYHYNLSTQGMPAGRYRIRVSLDDGTTRSMDFILR